MLTFAEIRLYPTLKLHYGTNEDEIESPLRYDICFLFEFIANPANNEHNSNKFAHS